MPRIFVYEHVTAVGLGGEPGSPHRSLWLEGRAMRDAVTADFAAVPGVEVLTFPDRLPEPEHLPTFRRLAGEADWCLVIAPETDGVLERLASEVVTSGGRLLGPNPDAIALTADKWRLAEHWRAHAIPTPRTTVFPAIPSYPFVLKPRDGAGSERTILVKTPIDRSTELDGSPGRMIAQEYVPGRPASVAFLIGTRGIHPLKPVWQQLSDDGRFRYLGGSLPLPQELADRAVRLGLDAVRCVPGLFGYVGVDLIIGATADMVVEINPRLTTSYIGLRAAAVTNLAHSLLGVCCGNAITAVWRAGPFRWDADGTRSDSRCGS